MDRIMHTKYKHSKDKLKVIWEHLKTTLVHSCSICFRKIVTNTVYCIGIKQFIVHYTLLVRLRVRLPSLRLRVRLTRVRDDLIDYY